ncbi:MAG: L,D-transpeptidase family protein, partial [Bacteroidetes bacterium]|nr:L,D-transpeptidase family protein [Bacteroidota bacterium]
MNYRTRIVLSLSPVLLVILLFSCHSPAPKADKGEPKPASATTEHVASDIKGLLEYVEGNGDKLNDSTMLVYRKLEDSVYATKEYKALWSDKKQFTPAGDSLFDFLKNCKAYGLFPSDYHYTSLSFIERLVREDTLARKNAALWSRADLMLTDAFFTLVKHLKQGRLDYDSVTLRKDSVLSDSIYTQTLTSALASNGVYTVLQGLEPKYARYDSLKTYLRDWLATARFKPMTWLDYPYKDSAVFYQSMVKRLMESGYVDSSVTAADTAKVAAAIRQYQTNNKLRVTGKPNSDLITMMNYSSDWEKFKRVAINMDRYKLLPDTLPKTYVWVDLPSFYLQVMDSDTVALESKIIVGSPRTRTPLLTSEISNFVTFPQWTVPMSIIMKEMLPAIKNNIDYLRKQNLMVVDSRDSV